MALSKGHRDGGQADQLRLKLFEYILQHGPAVRENNQIKNFYLDTGLG